MLKALDLYSGAGGATRGLQDAGFAVTGVDIVSQPRYVGDRFICADVLSLTAEFIASFDFVWSSPPCQFHSAMKVLHKRETPLEPDPRLRVLLKSSGKPFVIEDVEAAREWLIDPTLLCGTMFRPEAEGRGLNVTGCLGRASRSRRPRAAIADARCSALPRPCARSKASHPVAFRRSRSRRASSTAMTKTNADCLRFFGPLPRFVSLPSRPPPQVSLFWNGLSVAADPFGPRIANRGLLFRHWLPLLPSTDRCCCRRSPC